MRRARGGRRYVWVWGVVILGIWGCSDAPEYQDVVRVDVGVGDAGGGVDFDVMDEGDVRGRADVVDVPDAGSGQKFQLRGQLVPTGGLSMSDGFTLSGYLSPGAAGQASSSASFSLTMTAGGSQTSP